jgi:peptidyl-prolyl cis-trans isomerase A (cyclophilin A)
MLWLILTLATMLGPGPHAAGDSVVRTQKAAPVRVVIETEAGDIQVEIDTVRAPATAANFLKYVDAGLYDGGRFRRTVRPDNQKNNPVPISVIQATANPARRAEFFPPIPLERTSITGLLHKDGTLSMARSAPDSATNEFSICLGAQPELDSGGKRQPDGQGFAAFGRVVWGMEVVTKIHMAPADGETLNPMIKILKVRRGTK